MASTTEEKVREEQEEWEVEQEEPTTEETPENPGDGDPEDSGKALFDATDYDREDLQLPKVDGEGIDKIGISFSGTVLLDRANPNDVALMRAMKLGGDVTLQVEAAVSAKTTKYTTSREGELDAVVLLHGARVHTVYRPAVYDETQPESAEAA